MSAQQVRASFVSWGVCACVASLVGCNLHTVERLEFGGDVQTVERIELAPTPMDILWVIDNSGSMCQEQATLAAEFDAFIDTLAETTLDFHIAVTTTHLPPEEVFINDPVAVQGYIQSTPQPVPFSSGAECLGSAADGFAALRASLDRAIACAADPASHEALRAVTDGEIQCANNPNDCSGVDVASLDRDGNGFDTFDLFPTQADMRAIPRVLDSEAYRGADGALDTQQLQADFACASFVGTRGYGFEKGLQSAIEAVSPELTGGAVGDDGMPALEGGDPTAPNHGFIRKNAGFTLIFVTDENDCSNTSGLDALTTCDFVCDYANDPNIPDEMSGLTPVEQLKREFEEALAATKGREAVFGEQELVVASIHGAYERKAPSTPACDMAPEDEFVTCESSLGTATSGDRYERFMRQFPSFFPRRRTERYAEERGISVAEAQLDFDNVQEDSAICQGTFRPVFDAVSEFLASTGGVCADGEFVQLRLQREPEVEARFSFEELVGLGLCEAGSLEDGTRRSTSCVVDPGAYSVGPCPRNERAFTVDFGVAPATLAQQITGYRLELVYDVPAR